MKGLSIIRSQEWWSHKLPPLLAIAYATVLMSPVPLFRVAHWALFLLCALVVGAIYVSVINDITDLEEDIASGKANRIQQVAEKYRWFIPAICLLAGFIFGYFLYPDLLSCALYLSSWIVFSLYSIKPIRLKNRGIFGVFADGCGSHLFPSLLMVASMSYITNQEINWIWFAAVGVWALTYGLRGILWHQFADRLNDIKVNLNTYASKTTPAAFKNKGRFLIIVELAAFSVMLYKINLTLPFVGLGIYLLLVFLRYKINKTQVIIILKTNDQPFQILMADYYQMFFPVSLLVAAFISEHYNVLILACHLFLFPHIFWLAIYDYFYFFKVFIHKVKHSFSK
ncbi:UbiA family prenyltransferase [Pedobacter sp. Leaf194]|uniref:UbiA family prenyltransferase n=1 Tax=Pedobacter sp. Leaf194 TaxID=1736297 RepID=UPI000703225D|nr:UbiA family prenyltransferase [Pedobacter sp. Leaf194]KQS32513.1 hypothetical protein ASG14_16655 [Pedobacter sp. Leaf194]